MLLSLTHATEYPPNGRRSRCLHRPVSITQCSHCRSFGRKTYVNALLCMEIRAQDWYVLLAYTSKGECYSIHCGPGSACCDPAQEKGRKAHCRECKQICVCKASAKGSL